MSVPVGSCNQGLLLITLGCLQRLNLLRPPNNLGLGTSSLTHLLGGIQKGVVSISYVQGLIFAEPFLILSNNSENYLAVSINFELSFN